MKQFSRHIIVCLFLFMGVMSYASHILGGEITYQHLKNDQYRVTLNIYRDCNGCKINGKGGGKSSENCAEIEYLFVRGKNGSTTKETRFPLYRENIQDITTGCRSLKSACTDLPNSVFGIELHSFYSIVDLSQGSISGFCDYYFYVSIAERNSNISTGQASQNFFIDAYLNACTSEPVSSPNFVSPPVLISNNNVNQFQSYHCENVGDDSVSYSLCPALIAFETEAYYKTGFSYLNPITSYCPGTPCTPDPTQNPPIGVSFNKNNGSLIFMPTLDGERGIIAVKAEKFRKINGKWSLVSFIKRDLQLSIKTSDGNHTPTFLSKNYFEICEEELLEFKVETYDLKNSITNIWDTVHLSLNSPMAGPVLTEQYQGQAPFVYGTFNWRPQKGNQNVPSIYTFSITATDNNCPLEANSVQLIQVKVFPKEDNNPFWKDLGCGNVFIQYSKKISSSSITVTLTEFVTSKEIYRSAKTSDTISGLQNGKYILKVEALNEFGCNSVKLDTFAYLNQSYIHIKGDSIVCPENEIPYSILSNLSNNFKGHLKWYVDSQLSSSSDLPVFKFQNSSVLEARINLVKGKWNCTLKDKLQIHVQKNTVITGPDEIKVCYNSGLFDLNKVLVSPANGKWTSSSEKLVKSLVNTDDVYPYQQDTLPILYTLDDVCSSKKSIQFILQALPDIELSNATICDTNSAIYLRQMVRKPYNTNDFSYSWKLNDPSARMEEVNGRTVVYPVDLGIGSHLLFVECTGQNGCSAKDTGQINILPSVKIDLKPEVVCQNNGLVDLQKRFKVSPSGGSWSFFDFDLFDVHNRLKTDTCGTFSIKYIYDQFGCYDEKELSLVIQCQPDITTTMRKEVCFDELPLQLVGTPSGGNWQGAYINGDLFSPPVSGKQESYKLYYLLDEGSCRFVQNFDLRINPLPTIQLFTNKLVYCQGEDILVNGRVDNTNLLEFKYNSKVITEQIFNSQTFSNHYLSTAGKNQQVKLNQIFLKGTNTYGCSKNEILYFNLLPGPEIKTIEDIELCENVKLSVDPEILYSGSGNLSYQWFLNQNPFSTNKNLKELLAPGIYHFDLQVDDGNCSDKTAVKVTVKKAPVASFFVKPAETTSVFKPDFKFVNTSEGAQSYEWYLGNPKGVIHSRSKDVEYTYTDTGSYEIKLIAYNDEGCSSEFTKIVFVKPDILLFIPNAFSPDGKNEEKNNEFGVSINEYGSFQMEVFDRWGQKVFRTNDPDVKWDGTSNSVPCTPDIYFYSIEVYSITGRRYFYRGTITLIR